MPKQTHFNNHWSGGEVYSKAIWDVVAKKIPLALQSLSSTLLIGTAVNELSQLKCRMQ